MKQGLVLLNSTKGFVHVKESEISKAGYFSREDILWIDKIEKLGLTKSIYRIAKLFHERYEEHSKVQGWKTQESCRVEFDDLPAKNRQVMIRTVHDVLYDIVKSLINSHSSNGLSGVGEHAASSESAVDDKQVISLGQRSIRGVPNPPVSKSRNSPLELLRECERWFDQLNYEYGEHGSLCVFCKANGYSSDKGIIHNPGCLILKLREEIG